MPIQLGPLPGLLTSRFLGLGAIPLPPAMATMNYKLATLHPAQAVGYPAQGRGSDGDGGPTAGRPLAGVVAVSALGNLPCEIPHPVASRQSAIGTNHDLPGLGPPPSPCAPRFSPIGRMGNSSRGPQPAASAAPIRLKPRKFRLGTWNMKGHSGERDGRHFHKFPFAEELLLLENIDILVLTETHSTDFQHSRKASVLYQSGVSTSRASITVISRADSGWSCTDSRTLIPGYAALVKVHNHRSTESLWLLCVYANNSGNAFPTLTKFYSFLLLALARSIDSIPDWTHCFAAGDWNFVSHPEDAQPRRPAPARALSRAFSNILTLCNMRDVAGFEPLPRGWTFRGRSHGVDTLSRIDRLYCPTDDWFPEDPVSLPTLWSDHSLVWADCTLSRPKVQLAVPADHLPPPTRLDSSFWSSVMSAYSELVSSPVTLPRWSAFKKEVLRLGVQSKSRSSASKGKNWLAAFRGDALSPDEFDEAVPWLSHKPRPRPRWLWSMRWPAAAPEYVVPPHRPVPAWHPSPESPWFRSTLVPNRPAVGLPPFARGSPPPPCPDGAIERAILHRLLARRKSAKAKMAYMESHHTSEWYNLSSNKELDERGSRASVSVHGLRLSDGHPATSVLGEMVQIARRYFCDLHNPEPSPPDRLAAQAALLAEVSASYADIPPPPSVRSGPFVLDELAALPRTMHNTAPGPDGIPYSFWKSLHSRVDDYNSSTPDRKLPSFWSSFLALANDVKKNGSSRCRFKHANISMFYKKGDPTLPQNYRPISSMNTDCKLYTNLVNNRLSPWAVSKIHPDQKGFIPGRQIMDHTRLAYEVAHLADITGTRGFLVSLDQAKAYNRVDQSWLLRVLTAMRVDPDLCTTISDVIHGCTSRVRINGGYSTAFHLYRGVRQGDPLSCLLFNFSIEPLAMRLRAKLQGFTVHGLPPVKVLFYADDVNLFLSPLDSVPAIVECLDSTSFAIGSKFNHDKTDIKPLGSARFSQACHDSQSLVTDLPPPPRPRFSHVEVPRASVSDLLALDASTAFDPPSPACSAADLLPPPPPAAPVVRGPPRPVGQVFPGAYILAPDAPLRVLGVWVGSTDRSSDRWAQLLDHIRYLIHQWVSIGASLPNRVIIAKALLLSRCYWLLDGNGIPPSFLRKISSVILHFVRGRFSSAPYSLLESPLSLGGVNCPSLSSRKVAYDLKFLSDLFSGPSDSLWRAWASYDIALSSSTSKSSLPSGTAGPDAAAWLVRPFGGGLPHPVLRPFLQDTHTRSSSLSDRLCQAFESARSVGADPRCPFPPLQSRLAYPILLHPAFTPTNRSSAQRTIGSRDTCVKWQCFLSHGVVSVGHLVQPPSPLSCSFCSSKASRLLSILSRTPWDPFLPDRSSPPGLSLWPADDGPASCIRVFTRPSSIIATTRHRALPPASQLHMEVYRHHPLPADFSQPGLVVLSDGPPLHIWVACSVVPSTVSVWSSGVAWIDDSLASGYASVSDFPSDQRLSDVLSVIFALQSRPCGRLVLHTPSSYVLGLVRGSLVSRGWPCPLVGLGTHQWDTELLHSTP